ncbi:hypothetical protein ACN4EG_20275 [Alkalinema pantanalense CENA528]|uniref:hypothetical protein n=1 Tax=Alkalinema pantanalense TaxID=1620705 RepID=UPI003D6E3469
MGLPLEKSLADGEPSGVLSELFLGRSLIERFRSIARSGSRIQFCQVDRGLFNPVDLG